MTLSVNNKILKGALSVLLIFLLLAAATGSAMLLESAGIGSENTIMLYLLAVLLGTVLTHSYFYGILSAFAALMTYNYMFTIPRGTFHINSSGDVMSLAFFFVTAIVAGTITTRLQNQKDLAERNEKTARLLYEVTSGFTNVTGRENIILRGIAYLEEHAGGEFCVLLTDGSVYGKVPNLDAEEVKKYAIRGASGVLGYLRAYGNFHENEDLRELLFKAVAAQIGMNLDREYIYQDREEIRVAMEGEKLRSTFLRAIAHDLRTPLTALAGASSMLSDNYSTLSDEERIQLARDLHEESIWMDNLVENILDMTRISQASLKLDKEYEVVDDVVGEAVSHMKPFLDKRDFRVLLPIGVVELNIDGKMIAQVIINLLDNAIRHTPPQAEIRLIVTDEEDAVKFSVEDTGNGIDEQKKKTLFRSFSQTEKSISDGQRGMGLGLSICQAILEAHGGRIWVEDNHPHGAKFVFILPKEVKNGNKA